MFSLRVLPAALLLAVLGANLAHAGTIRGIVRVSSSHGDAPSFRPYAGRASSLPAPGHAVKGRVTDAVLWLTWTPARSEGEAGVVAAPRLAQQQQMFEPRVVVVPVGGSVSFPNLDPIYHNVFSVSPTKRFDLGKYGKGQSRTVRFEKPGVVNVYCDIHTDMAAFIVVAPSLAWARPGDDGRYELRGLPGGRYHLVWWHPDARGGEADVDVPAEGEVTWDVNF